MKHKQYLLMGFLTVGGLLQANLGMAEAPNASASVQVLPDGSKTIKEADGTVVEVKPDGSKLIKKPDGTTVEVKPDGTKVIQNKDGSTVEVKPGK